jgi:hypothetical protein
MLSAIASASSTSTPRYLTVLSKDGQHQSGSALTWTHQARQHDGGNPAIHSSTKRPYCLVVIGLVLSTLLGKASLSFPG